MSQSLLLVAKYLISEANELDINFAKKKKLNTALHYFIWSTTRNRTQLHEACQERDIKKVIELVNNMNHDINAQDNSGLTPLHTACYSGFSDVVQVLMMAGANETITDDYNRTPAQLDVKSGHKEMLELLDRVSLWRVLQKTKTTIPIGFLVVLAVRLVKKR